LTFCILVRNPNSTRVQMIVEPDVQDIFEDSPRVVLYETEEEAEEDALTVKCIMAGWPYRVVETP
jgi:hypothetical protein